MTALHANLGFVFPGQGSYNPVLLKELLQQFPENHAAFAEADRICERFMGYRVTPIFAAADHAEHDRLAADCRDMDQIGIFLASYLTASVLRARGINPTILLGHSFGEIAALADSGAFSLSVGLKIVCQRVHALQHFARSGGMMAVACAPERIVEVIAHLDRKSLFLAVVNHARQSVVSGTAEDLDVLSQRMNSAGVSTTRLRSRYPFHSPLLANCVEPFQHALYSHEFDAPETDVYLATSRRMLDASCNLALMLSDQFVQPLYFEEAACALYERGISIFVECGAGGVVTRIVQAALGDRPHVQAIPAVSQSGLKSNLTQLEQLLGTGELKQGHTTRTVDWSRSNLAQLAHETAQVAEALQSTAKELSRLATSERSEETRAGNLHAHDNRGSENAGLEHIGSASKTQDESSASSEVPPALAVAIVAKGCVLPGAQNEKQYWNNVLEGVSGIVDMAHADPLMAADFKDHKLGDEIKVKPDKTYTLLHGSVGEIAYDPQQLSGKYSREEFAGLSRAERLLALALAQSAASLKSKLEQRVLCVLGATADGCAEYDEALFSQRVTQIVAGLDEPAETQDRFLTRFKQRWSEAGGRLRCETQHSSYREVCRRVFGEGIDLYILDAACSSSLYAVNLGIKALESNDADLVIAGGVFAPGPANNALFAQFRGLTPSQSRPLDAGADGVVFGDGAAILLLKRLPDAMRDGDNVAGVIRGMGISSDGKSPATNVPQAKGQSLAVRRAYEQSRIDPATIQYVEAHATATPVGDAVEFGAIASVFTRHAHGNPVELGSVKALIGHTGWAAGAASVIKLCLAFAAETIPPQFNYSAPNAQIDLENSPFTIPLKAHAWPPNVAGAPRRAAVNGFGFGGTNAHLVLEAFDPVYHAHLASRMETPAKATREVGRKYAIVGWSALFPQAETLAADTPSQATRFRRDRMRLPAGKRLLPDVLDHLDPSQYLALLSAEEAIASLSADWRGIADETAVVLGLESKTERGIGACERIFKDRLHRLVAGDSNSNDAEMTRLLEKIIHAIDRRNLPSNAYTLPGFMPNVATGRVANVFDLSGPNVVVDKGRESLAEALRVGVALLDHGDCKLVLAGGMHAAKVENAIAADESSEASVLLAVTTFDIAEKRGFRVVGTLDASGSASSSGWQTVPDLRGATGAREIAQALRKARNNNTQATIMIPAPGQLLSPTPELGNTIATQAVASKAVTSAKQVDETNRPTSPVYQYVQGTPIWLYSPTLVEVPATQAPFSLEGRRILFVTDSAEYWRGLEQSGALRPFNYSVLCSKGSGLHNAVEVDVDREPEVWATLGALVGKFDVIVAVKQVEEETTLDFLEESSRGDFTFLHLLFAVCRCFYEEIVQKKISIVSVCLNAFHGEALRPYSGLVAGFMKSIARECPESVVRALNLDSRSFLASLVDIEQELGQGPAVEETCIRGGKRHTVQLRQLPANLNDGHPYLDSDSVVIATGGGRGVTAVMVEELLSRFHCKVIAVGRTDPSAAPAHILAMSDAEFAAYETAFYAEQMRAAGAKKISEAKQQYGRFLAARELAQVEAICKALPGSYEYVCGDITDPRSVEVLVEDVYRRYGRVDLLMHGAGIQISRVVPKKSLADFRKVVDTKLASLGLLYKACQQRQGSHPLHVHLLTSAFSYMGNDGQPDYGAANEALNRIAQFQPSSPKTGVWSSMAWLGWAGIGMTRGSEYAALAASRRLRGVTREEGRKIFADLIAGVPAQPTFIQIAEGEVAHYGVVFAPDLPAYESDAKASRSPAIHNGNENGNGKHSSFHLEREISLADMPYLSDHRVNGAPTLPGAFLIAEIGAFATQTRPDLKIVRFEDAIFHRFVKLPEDRAKQLSFEGEMLEETASHALLRVKVYADFIHRSGAILQKNVLQTEVSVRMAGRVEQSIPNGFHDSKERGIFLEDPYVMAGSPVSLKGSFRTMSNIVAGSGGRSADYQLDTIVEGVPNRACSLSTILMMDSLWRFGAIVREPDNSMPVYVPVKCDVMKIHFDFAEPSRVGNLNRLSFRGANPSSGEESIVIGPVAALDDAGDVLLVVEGGVCRRYGTVNYERD
jgi:acyl transferase domain-containing protein/NAD(P)-dependent dehydrogenase (short-subunit alcohol dehydrogenase family)